MLLMTRTAVSTSCCSSRCSRHTSLAGCPVPTQRLNKKQRYTAVCAKRNTTSSRGFGKKQQAPQSPPDDAVLWQQLLAAECPGLERHTKGRTQPAALTSFQAGESHAPYVGPVSLQVVQGCGRGLTASRDVEQGEVLLVANPLVLATEPAGQTPQPNQLVSLLMKGLQVSYEQQTTQQTAAAVADSQGLHMWWQAFWTLYDGTKQRSDRAQDSPDKLPDLLQLASVIGLPSQQHSRHPGTAAAADTAALPAGALQNNTQPTAEANPQAQLMVDNRKKPPHMPPAALTRAELRAWQQAASKRAQFNAYGEAYQDVVLATLAQQPFKAHIGIWPAMAMANHSCSPNACVVLTGTGQLILRAAVHIPAGQEVTISYAGSHAGSPISVRRQALQSGFGFLCQCDRCLVEQDYEQELVGKKAMSMHRKVEGLLRPQLLDALNSGNHDMIHSAHKQLSRLAKEYKAAVKNVPDEEDQTVLQCSSLPLVLELISLCQRYTPLETHEGGVGRVQLGLERLQLVQCIAPGSYAHVQLAAATLLDVVKQGRHLSPDELVQECLQAHLARYGPITDVTTLFKALHAHDNNTLADDIADAQVAAIADVRRADR